MISYRKKKLLLWTSALAVFLTALALIPGSICHAVVKSEVAYIVCHIVAHCLLAVLFCLFLRFQRRVGQLSMTAWNITWLASIASTLFGGGIEALQIYVPGRIPDWGDFYWNTVGTILGITAFLIFRKTFRLTASSIKEQRRLELAALKNG